MAGLQLNSALQKAQDYGNSLGLRLTSGFRGGSTGPSGRPDSHSKGMAMDFAGPKDSMEKFATYAKQSGLFTEVLWQVDGHYDHVHVGWETGKHQDGMMYIGNHQLQPIPKGGADVPGGAAPASGTNDKGIAGKVFHGVIRGTLITVFLILSIYFLYNAFPALKVNLPI
ncbi:hypothetical protein ABE244_25590 [Bacillus toyonensis]|uniref:hypothetical protein n=1 Tax=Bacillus toyonensis TaxID=155322 RepID=UPI003D1BB6E6